MSDGDKITSVVRERQLAVRRELDRRHIPLKVVSLDSGIPYQTIISYFPGEKDKQPAVMPLSAFYRLIGVLPRDLIDLLLPTGNIVIKVPEDVDFDDLAAKASDFVSSYIQTRHPDSEGGADLGTSETTNLSTKAAGLRAVGN